MADNVIPRPHGHVSREQVEKRSTHDAEAGFQVAGRRKIRPFRPFITVLTASEVVFFCSMNKVVGLGGRMGNYKRSLAV